MKKKNPRIGGIGVRVEWVMITNFTLLRGQGEGRGCMGEGVVFRFRELYFLRFSVIMINLNTPPPSPRSLYR